MVYGTGCSVVMVLLGAILVVAFVWLLRETDGLNIRLPCYLPRQSRRELPRALRLCVLIMAPLVIVILLSPLAVQYLFFGMPGASDDFDCDDSALLVMERLEAIGIAATPLLGSLKKTGEAYIESDHVWVIAHISGWHIPLDWGTFAFDSQHYEGFPLTSAELLFFVEQDRQLAGSQALPAAR